MVTRSQNELNKFKLTGKSSIYKGVSRFKDKWIVQVVYKGRLTFIGLFEDEKDAALTADLWNRDIHGEFAKTNFPVIFALTGKAVDGFPA